MSKDISTHEISAKERFNDYVKSHLTGEAKEPGEEVKTVRKLGTLGLINFDRVEFIHRISEDRDHPASSYDSSYHIYLRSSDERMQQLLGRFGLTSYVGKEWGEENTISVNTEACYADWDDDQINQFLDRLESFENNGSLRTLV